MNSVLYIMAKRRAARADAATMRVWLAAPLVGGDPGAVVSLPMEREELATMGE